MYHLRKLKSLLLLLLVAVMAKAQISDGKVYNFVNVAHPTKSMVISSDNYVGITDTDTESYNQLWYVSMNGDNSYCLRNLGNGLYLRSSNVNLEKWTMVKDIDENCKFDCTAVGTGYAFRATNATGVNLYMHYGSGSGRIVCYHTNDNATRWNFNEVVISDDELNANWEFVTALNSGEIYQTALSTLFTDNSCSELKPAYASYTKAQMMNDANYQKLSATLQKMVLKMCTDGTWQENNFDNSKGSWDATRAKKYRVQLYEPYNTLSAASKALSLNEHTNMNNPTGIFSGGREVIYVMVEGTIGEGASLYLDSYTGHNKLSTDHKKGIQLTEGLNVIPSDAAGNNYFINYVVETFDVSDEKRGHEAKARSLKDYAPLKIHVEGGYINGYYNKVGDALYGSGDKNADWEYIEERATQTDVTVLGKYMTLQFPLRDADTEGNKGLGSYLNESVQIEDVINSWDNVMMWERLLLGVLDESVVNAEAKKSPYSITNTQQVIEYTGNDQDYPTGYGDYYNIHGLAFGVGGSAYMYGSGDHSGYHYNTMEGIIQNIPTNAGSHWGPAHEIGHQHQNLLKIRKEMEVTNNLFSNVVLWFFGETTSRVNGTEGSLENVLLNFNKEDGHYLTNNIWGMTQMYYKLFLYYHVLGHNPKFYPRLFEILRQDPSNGMGGTVNGEEAQLHIYKKMCLAAGEDLTEFFRAHGFLKPLDGFAIDDYGVSTFYMTQAQIDAAIAEVKSCNYKENVAVLFINDATGETIKSHKGDNLDLYGETRVCAEVGGYASFEKSITNAEDLDFTVSGKTVTVNKGGGVGYAIFNEKGEIMAFSDKKTFTVSDECATALMWGEAIVKVVNADNSVVDVDDVNEVASKYTLLGDLIAEVDVELTYLDATNTKVGYYKEGVLAALQTARDEAKEVYDSKDTQSYTAAYTKLCEELYAVTHNGYNRVGIIAGGTYRLKNRNANNWMSVNGENNVIGEATDESSTKQQWIFEAAGEDDTYYIKNASTSLYIGGAKKNEQVATQAEAKAYKLASVETGVWTLQCQDSNLQWLNHNGGTVLGWNDGNDYNSQWYITFKSVTQDAEKLHQLNTLVKKTKELIDEMAEVTPLQKQTLQTESSSSPFYLSTNACHNTLNNASDGQGLAGLLDEDAATYFHSDYNGRVSETHYLQVDLGSAIDLSDYIFYYTTRDNGNNCPTTIEVWGSTDGTSFDDTPLYTFTELPTDGKQSWESPMLTEVNVYRSLRFMVTAAEGGKKFFVMSRFGFAKCEATVQSIGSIYAAQGLRNQAIVDAYASIHSISDKIKVGGATLNDLSSLYSQLETKYNNLEDIYNAAHSAGLIAKKAELNTLIEATRELIASCGDVNYTPSNNEKVQLQAISSDEDYYLYCNALYNKDAGNNSGDNCMNTEKLLDGDLATHLHTDNNTSASGYKADDDLDHYLRVDMGTENRISNFLFTYTTRNAGSWHNHPKVIVVEGCNDLLQYEFSSIATITDLQDKVSWTYISQEIECAEPYRYIRFMVTDTYSNNVNNYESYGNHPYFYMAEFGLTQINPECYDVTLGAGAGGATEELLLATYMQKTEAQIAYEMAVTESQLQKTIDKLVATKTALEEARNAARDYTIITNIEGGGVTFEGGEPCTSTLTVPASLTLDELKAKLTAINLSGYVAQSITINEGVITVIYNKVYTVYINGGEGEGRITFNGTAYANERTFDALQGSFTAEDDLTASDVTGYDKSKVTVDHETGIISVTYTLDRTELETLIGETNELMQSCLVFVNSAYVTEQLLTNTSTAITAAMGTFSKEDLTYAEYTAAVSALQTAYSTLNTAKGNAENEVAARNQLKEQLSTLIGETETLIASCYENDELKYINSEFVTDVSIAEIRSAIETAQAKCNTNATTEEQYNASLEALGRMKANLATAIEDAKNEANDRLASRVALMEKIEALGDVIDLCGVVEWGRYPTGRVAVPLTEANLSTNAQEASEGPIKNLLTDDGFFHSSWTAAMGGEHYLQVDLGEGRTLQEFVFGYTTRGNGPHPYIIVVSGSNSLNDSFEEIKVFNSGLPNSGSTSWEATAPIIASQPYRYLRFTVTKSSDLSSYGEYCFAMSKFELKTITYSESEDYYVEYLNPNGSVTEVELLDAYRAMIAAGDLNNVNTTKSDLDAKIDELQTLCTQLTTKRNTLQLPVELTTNIKDPVLYAFKSRRGDTKALQYDPSANHMFSIADASANGVKQMFYFTVGDTRTQVYVHPFVAGEQVLAANNTGNGAAKVFAAVNPAESMARQWTFESETVDGTAWYSLKGVGTSYFSHYGGGSNKMGFYGSKDDGSRFQFIDVDETALDGNSAYHSLKVYYDEVTKVKSSEIQGDSKVGYYPENEADTYNSVYANASELLKETSEYDDCLAAYRALVAANEVLAINMPVVGKYYVIRSAHTGYAANQLIYATGENAIRWDLGKTEANPEALWTFTNDGYLENLQTGCAMNTTGGEAKLGDSPKTISIKGVGTDGQVLLTPAGGTPLHADWHGHAVSWGTYDAGSASAWRIVEVEDMSLVEFALTIGQYRHAGLYLNYATVIPEGIKAYIVNASDEEEGVVIADELEGTILPARTAVIVKGDADDYIFKYTAEDYDGTDNPNENLLGGSAYLKYQQVKEAGNLCCVFGQKSGEVGLYKNWVGYSDANGTLVDSNEDSKANEDDGTHFKVSANKIYYEYKPSTGAGASAFRFRFNSKEEDATPIGGLLITGDTVIYNLYGQRLIEIVEPGIYIINGKKMYVSEKMIGNNK